MVDSWGAVYLQNIDNRTAYLLLEDGKEGYTSDHV